MSHGHAGILAHSAEGAALCFLTFCQTGFSRLGDHQHPDVTMDCIAMAEAMEAWEAGDYPTINAIFARSVDRLKAAGADFFVCPDNTAHIAMEAAQTPFALPALNIGDVVAEEAARLGLKKIAVLGTRWTMEGPVYPRALTARGLDYATPNEAEKALIQEVIFSELVLGTFKEESRAAYIEVIERLKAEEGCDGAALVCTEIPILVPPDRSPLPVLDSTRLLARAAFEVCIGERAAPSWAGGPVAG